MKGCTTDEVGENIDPGIEISWRKSRPNIEEEEEEEEEITRSLRNEERSAGVEHMKDSVRCGSRIESHPISNPS